MATEILEAEVPKHFKGSGLENVGLHNMNLNLVYANVEAFTTFQKVHNTLLS